MGTLSKELRTKRGFDIEKRWSENSRRQINKDVCRENERYVVKKATIVARAKMRLRRHCCGIVER